MQRIDALAMLFAALAGPAALTAAGPAAAQSGQDRAREERLEGSILGYEEIVARAKQAVPGRVVGQNLVRAGPERYVYRLKILQSGGKVARVSLDAKTGEILSVQGRR